MKLFTRISATLNAGAESAVSRFENHEAIAESVLKSIRQNASEARVRHQRVVRDGQDLRRSIQNLNQQIEQWSSRARACATDDESRALACLERRASCRKQLAQAEEALRQHMALEARASSDLEKMQTRLEQVTLQRNQLRSRESVAKATRALDAVDGQGSAGINELFERWEVVIGESEILSEAAATTTDPLAREFENEEQCVQLRGELEELLHGDSDDHQ
ncbi:PspA/IM30 family protein [Granulosicoccus sp. 3-233]|uniref:PspA/IM30 family protein n=1 Tax=Granulosicoccus sp. 3-233 TaxID=3417969 RepID=UPI003D32A10A